MKRDEAARGIYQRGEIYWLAVQVAGKRSFVSLETRDFSEAVSRAAEVRGAPAIDGRALVNSVDEWVADRQAAGRFGRSCAENARYALRRFVRLVGEGKFAHEVTACDARRYAASLDGLSTSTRRTYLALCRMFFQWAVDRGRTRGNPFAGVELPRGVPAARREFCTAVQRDAILSACQRDDLGFALHCGFHAGFRRNEIVHARPGWFNVTGRMIHLKKLGAREAAAAGLDAFDLKDREERSLPMTRAFADWLAARPALLAGDYCIGVGLRTRRARYRYDLRRPFEAHMAGLGLDWVTWHTMRRTFCSLLVSAGVSPYMVAGWIGDDLRTFQRHYGHLAPAHDQIERAF